MSTSASQMKTFEDCKRKWWLEKRAKVRTVQKQFLIIGTALHAVAERYQKREPLYPPAWDRGTTPEQAAWIRSRSDRAIALGLWQADPSLQFEAPVCALVGPVNHRGLPVLAQAEVSKSPEGVNIIAPPTTLIGGQPMPLGWLKWPYLVGFIDVLDLRSAVPRVLDHKTTKNRRYAKTPNSLATDTQMLSYSSVVLAMRGDADTTEVQHNVFIKEGATLEASVYAVKAKIKLDAAAGFWHHAIDVALEMKNISDTVPVGVGEARANNFEAVEGVMESRVCDAYGKCPFKDACYGHKSIVQVVRTLDADVAAEKSRATLVQRNGSGQARTRTYQLQPRRLPASNTPTQEHRVPFPPKKAQPQFLTIGALGYVRDPEVAKQYQAHVSALLPTGDVKVVLWIGEPPAAPKHISEAVDIDLPAAEFSPTPFSGIPVVGYSDAPAAPAPAVISVNTPPPRPVGMAGVAAAAASVLTTPAKPAAAATSVTAHADKVLAQAKDAPASPAAPQAVLFRDVGELAIDGIVGSLRIGATEMREAQAWGEVLRNDGTSTKVMVPLKSADLFEAAVPDAVFEKLFGAIGYWIVNVKKEVLPEPEPKKRGRKPKDQAAAPAAVAEVPAQGERIDKTTEMQISDEVRKQMMYLLDILRAALNAETP